MYKHSVFLLLSVLLIVFTWKLFSCQYKCSVDKFTGSFNTKIQHPVLTLSTCFASYSKKGYMHNRNMQHFPTLGQGRLYGGVWFCWWWLFWLCFALYLFFGELLRLAWDFFKQLKSVLHKATFPIPGSRNKQHFNIYSDQKMHLLQSL